jgi:hypothetical protein
MTCGLTWARSEADDRALAWRELSRAFLKAKIKYQEERGCPPPAVQLSRETLLSIPLPYQSANPVSTFYGVPIEINDSLALWEFKEVHA